VYQIPRTLCKPVKNAADCQIRNAGDGEGNGQLMNLKQATGASVNTVFAQLINDVGIKDTAEMAKKLGISSNSYIPKVHGLSYTLGVEPVSPLDMASAYGVFDNHGRRAEPIPVLTVKDSTGKVLEDNSKPATSQVIAANVADNVTDLLRAPVAPGGTAYPRADIGRPAAGKTGTTEDNVDAWFVGFTPTVSTSVWMGYAANEKTKMRNIKGVREVFGGTLPAQVWHDFMKPALAKVAVTNFDQPAPIVPLKRDLNKEARGGLDPGDRRGIADTPLGGPYVVAPGEPTAVAPTTSTSAPPPVESTTTTTAPAAAKPPGSTTTTLVPRP
jgi:membrane peptidoglycan carboxypeptidase